jgi:hypothetical protein
MSDEEPLPPPPPPLVFASVAQDGDGWRVDVSHPDYGGGATVQLTGYTNEEAANEGARWWDERLQNNPPGELVCMTGERYERSQA